MPDRTAGRMSTATIAGIIGLALVGVILLVLLLPQLSGWFESKTTKAIHTAVDGASAICLRDYNQHQNDSVAAGVKSKLVAQSATGSITRDQVSVSVDLAISEAGLLGERKRVSDCMAAHVDELLAVQGLIARQPELTPAPAVEVKFDQKCLDAKLADLVGPRPVQAHNSVRCEGGGHHKEGSIGLSIEPGFRLLELSVKENSNNRGSVGPIQTVTHGSDITAASVQISCSSPHQMFGPGAWEDATLTGETQRISLPSDGELASLKQQCPASQNLSP